MKELLINILMYASLAMMIFMVVIIIYNFIKKRGYERVKYLKNYKKGRFVFIYIAVLLISYANELYKNGFGLIANLTRAIKQTVESVVLKINYDNVSTFFSSNSLFATIITLCYILVIINSLLFIVSIAYNRIWLYCKGIQNRLKKNNIIFIGYNPETLKIIKTIDNGYGFMGLDSFEKIDIESLLANKVPYRTFTYNSSDEIYNKLVSIIKRYKMDNVHVVINTNDEKKNLIVTKELTKIILSYNTNILGYVLGNGDNETAFIHHVEKSNGRIHYLEKHKMVAFDFIEKYPLTKFMDERHIDYNTATIKAISINVYMIGFGKTNRQIFLSSVANNQFITIENGIAVSKNVNYYVYDNKNPQNNKNMNHYFYRLENEENYFINREDEFLSPPIETKPANVFSRGNIDINDAAFYKSLKTDIASTGPNDINYVIVSFGSETDNIDMAEKLAAKAKEWNVSDQTKIFVRVKDANAFDEAPLTTVLKPTSKDAKYDFDFNGIKFSAEVTKNTNDNMSLYYVFGDENEVVYNIDKILNEKPLLMAKERNVIYDLEYLMSNSADKVISDELKKEVITNVNKNWYSNLTQIQRDSNIYVCLAIRSKLNLLGFDYIKDDEMLDNFLYQEVDFDEYNDAYFAGSNAKADESIFIKNQAGDVIEKKIYNTELTYKTSPRTYLCMQEHLRWNAFTIIKGVIPSTRQEIITSLTKGKDYKVLRKHGCITTFEGLKEFRYIDAVKNYMYEVIKESLAEEEKTLAKTIGLNMFSQQFDKCTALFDKLSEDEKNMRLKASDVIKYDFQILDDLEWLFKTADYKLIKKKKID